MLESLDPRVNRLGLPDNFDSPLGKVSMDQFETYEAFVMTKPGKPFEHVGIVHAPNEEMAWLFSKEQYTRRGMVCHGLAVIKTENIKVSSITDNNVDVYDAIEGEYSGKESDSFEIFHLLKRGKQHKHIGGIMAADYEDAMKAAKNEYERPKTVYNVWVVKSEDIFSSDEEDTDIWDTLKEKKYRDAIDYKAADKIKAFKAEQS